MEYNIIHSLILIFFIIISLISFSLQIRDLRIIEENGILEEDEEQNFIEPPGFSKISGFYPENFKLKLSSEKDTTIYYTIDSSDPRTSNTSQEYKDYILVYDKSNEPNIYSNINENENSPVSVSRGNNFKGPVYPVDKAFIVRAVAKNSKGEFSEINSRTYFITTDVLEIYQDFTVISIVTNPENLFDPDIGIYVTGTMYQEWKKSDDYDPKQSPWDKEGKCNYFMRGKEWEREAFVTIFEKGEKILQQNMGIRIKGASTRNNPGKSFNLYAKAKYGKSSINAEIFKDNYDINGKLITEYKTLSLRCIYENNRLKDKFGWDLFGSREHLTSANMKNVILFLNGEYWGLYTLQEKVDRFFIENNYLIPSENIALSKNGESEEGPIEEWDKLNNFADLYSKKDLADKKVYEEISNYIDIDSFIEMFATGMYISIGDWPRQNSGEWKNLGNYINGNKYSDGKWRFMIFDLDFTMGSKFAGVGEVNSDDFIFVEKKSNVYPANLFIGLLKNNSEFRNKFINVYCDYANEVYNSKKVNKIIEEYRNNMVDFVAYSQLRWWGYSSKLEGFASYKERYQKALDTIADFFERRPEYTLQHTKDYLDLKGELIELTIEIKGRGKIQINSISPDFINGKWTGKYFSRIPIILKAIPDVGYYFKEWDGYIISNKQNEEVILYNSETIIAVFD